MTQMNDELPQSIPADSRVIPATVTAAKANVVRNIAFNFVGYGVNFLVAFIVGPVLVHRLGNEAYGIWALLQQLIGYTSLFDFGVRIAVTRDVARLEARGERGKVSEVLSTAFLALSVPAIVIIVLSLLAAYRLPYLFHIPAKLLFASRVAIILSGSATAISLPGALFSGCLGALSRYDLLNLRNATIVLLRGLLLWLLLNRGAGLITVAAIFLASTVIGYLVDLLFTRAQLPELTLRLKLFNRERLRQLFNFSLYVFLVSVSVRVIMWSDNLVVGYFLGPAAVAFYAIGGALVDSAREAFSGVTMVFSPLAAHMDALNQKESLRRLFLSSSRIGIAVSIPITIVMVMAGRSILNIWMGPQYALNSTPVLIILALTLPLSPLGATRTHILYAMFRHKLAAWVAVVDGVANLILSVLLVKRIGIAGVAWGTLIPDVIAGFFVMPIYTCALLDIKVLRYGREVFLKPLVTAFPAAVLLWFAVREGWLRSWPLVALCLACTMVIYGGVAWRWVLREEERERLLRFWNYKARRA
jgi:O-antigen/teichoic acid export membrane protein